MIPARSSQRHLEKTKLMVIEHDGEVRHSDVHHLKNFLHPGDLLVVNRSGTLPSSFHGQIARTHQPIEIRLASYRGSMARWVAVIFGHGSWRQATEARGPTPQIYAGDMVHISPRLQARVVSVDKRFSRLIEIEFSSSGNLLPALYESGRPIQYSYLKEELQIWDQQTLFAGPPLSVEPPSAAFPLSWERVLELKNFGVGIATVLHAAGLSSTGDAELDAQLPLAEYFEVPQSTADAVRRTHGRVVALGTTVTRALESAAQNGGNLVASRGYTDFKLGPNTQLRVVDSLLTGMHEDGTSHAQLISAFCSPEWLTRANAQASKRQYRSHEYGDLTLIHGERNLITIKEST